MPASSSACLWKSAILLVPGLKDEMPVVGGKIIELGFMPDNNIAFGYLDDYLLVERGAVEFGRSDEAFWTADKIGFKGTGRFDGQPSIAEAFGIMTITATAPTTSLDFPQDSANPQ